MSATRAAQVLRANPVKEYRRMNQHLMQTYARLPVSFVRGQGVWLWDDQGHQYLDALSGIGVCALGHAHPRIRAALAEQSELLMHTSNLYQIPAQQALAETLTGYAGMERAFFSNSGAEAVEAALKIARLHGHQKGIEKPAIVVTENSFHGRTLATLSATGNRKVHAGFEPLVQGFVRCPFNDIAAIETIADSRQDISAVLVEPIQGEGGIHLPDDDYLVLLRQLCDQRGWLLMLDEIQTGLCRTGQWFAWQQDNARPDVMTVAKALGNGFPIGACLAQGKAAELFQPGNHGSTYGGNPLACHVARTTLAVMAEENLAEHARHQGRCLLESLQTAFADNSKVGVIRGRGLMIGLELTVPCENFLHLALQQGLLVSLQAGNIVRLLPPLIINNQQLEQIVERLQNCIAALPQ